MNNLLVKYKHGMNSLLCFIQSRCKAPAILVGWEFVLCLLPVLVHTAVQCMVEAKLLQIQLSSTNKAGAETEDHAQGCFAQGDSHLR